MLHTTFEVVAGDGFVQRALVVPEADAPLCAVSASSCEAVEAVVAADAAAGFELMGEGGRALRCTLVRVEAEAHHLLLMNVHHIAFDGMYPGVMLHELGALYRALSVEGGTLADAGLAELPFQYVDYALWHSGATRSRRYSRACSCTGGCSCVRACRRCSRPYSTRHALYDRRSLAAVCRKLGHGRDGRHGPSVVILHKLTMCSQRHNRRRGPGGVNTVVRQRVRQCSHWRARPRYL